MKLKFLLAIATVFIFTVLLTACGGTQDPPVVNTEQPAVAVTEGISNPAPTATESTGNLAPAATESSGNSAPTATIAPASPGEDVMALIQEKLQNHHSIDRILNAKHTREEWNTTLNRMIKYGAKINEDEKKIIIDFLLSRQ